MVADRKQSRTRVESFEAGRREWQRRQTDDWQLLFSDGRRRRPLPLSVVRPPRTARCATREKFFAEASSLLWNDVTWRAKPRYMESSWRMMRAGTAWRKRRPSVEQISVARSIPDVPTGRGHLLSSRQQSFIRSRLSGAAVRRLIVSVAGLRLARSNSPIFLLTHDVTRS